MFFILMSGTNFGLNDSLEYTEFELDSWDCTQSYNSGVSSLNWPKFYLGKPLTNVAAVKIIEAQIPFTFYIFNSLNNTFMLVEHSAGGGVATTTTVTIPAGNYTSSNFNSVFAAALNAATSNAWVYSVSFSQVTLKYTITNTNATVGNFFSFVFGTSGDIGTTNPRLFLGFNAGTSNSSTPTQTLVAQNVAQLSGPNYIYLNSRQLGPLIKVFLPGNGIVNPVGAGADGPQMAKLPMTVNAGQVFNWMDPNPLMWFDVGNTTFSGSFDFYVTLGTSELPLDFNGEPFSLKLGVLTNMSSHNDWLGGGKEVGRVEKRSRR